MLTIEEYTIREKNGFQKKITDLKPQRLRKATMGQIRRLNREMLNMFIFMHHLNSRDIEEFEGHMPEFLQEKSADEILLHCIELTMQRYKALVANKNIKEMHKYDI
tara:strand:- start:132 stop:449 length:318 start_codon:yes stop_codon:yes gene_type:complete